PSLAGQTINLTSGELLIQKNVTIQGLGASQLTVSAGGHSRAFEVAAKYGLTVSGLTISNGNAGSPTVYAGGGGIDNHGTLTVNGCTLSGNTPAYGGAIFNDSGATMTVSGCTLSGNTSDAGGNSLGGAIYNSGTATISNSTLSGNRALGGDYTMGDG